MQTLVEGPNPTYYKLVYAERAMGVPVSCYMEKDDELAILCI